MALSVVIATYNDPLGLYLTFFSMWMHLKNSVFSEWEIIIAADNGTDYKWEKYPNVRCLRLTGGNRTGSPQGTRDAGIRAAKYETVLCIESHVAVSNVHEWLSRHWSECGNPALSFCPRIGEGPEMYSSFGYEQDWDSTFWNKKTVYDLKIQVPHRIVGFGHAAFMVNREWYLRGGYFLEMVGWGGEEPDLNLLAWHTGQEVWMIPSVAHAHYLTPGAHASTTSSDNFKRNFCIAAYEHGGAESLQKIETRFGYRLQRNSAIEARRQLICQGKFGGDLNKLRQWLQQTGVLGV